MTQRDELIVWLNDARAMELSQVKVLKKHIQDAQDFPDLQGRLHQHLAETQRHAERIKQCIDAIGGKVSRGKINWGALVAGLTGGSTSIYKDDVIKDALSESASEHFEVACYNSLIAAAEKVDEPKVVEACRKNREEDEAMAKWVDDQLPEITRRFMTTKLTVA